MKRAWLAALIVAAVATPFVMGQDKKEPEKKEARTAYLRRIYATDRCTYGDGLRSIAGLVSGAPAEEDFAAVAEGLKAKGIVPAEWNDPQDAKLTKGTLAYLLCRTLDIKGGATMMLTGTSRRYALRECIYLGLIGVGSTDEYVNGRELLDVMQRAAVYKAEGSLDRIRK